MICKYYLMIGFDMVDIVGNSCIDVLCMIVNISDIKIIYSCVDLGGVVCKCGSMIEFVEEVREWFILLYNKDKLKLLVFFVVYGISNNWIYNKFFECFYDFFIFRYDLYWVRIGCIDNFVVVLIKVNKGIIYEYFVFEMCEDIFLNYDGVCICNEVFF